MLPSKKMLKAARAAAYRLSQQTSEKKGNIHYGVFLLCFRAGLRVSEAISFTGQPEASGLYVVKSKKTEFQRSNKQIRKVAVSEKIVQELKAND